MKNTENIVSTSKKKQFIITAAVVLIIGAVFITQAPKSEILSKFTSDVVITSENAASNWTGQSDNPYRNILSVEHVQKLDTLILAILSKGTSKSNETYLQYLTNLTTGFNGLLKKDQYANNAEIKGIIQYLLYEVNLTYKTIENSSKQAIDNKKISNISSTKDSKFDEIWDYGFYVISHNNDYDGDGDKEGCNEYGLESPEDFCVLKIDKMYVSPKNYTLKGTSHISANGKMQYISENFNFVSKPKTSADLSIVLINNQADENCTNTLNNLRGNFTDSDGRITNYDEYSRQSDIARLNGHCKASAIEQRIQQDLFLQKGNVITGNGMLNCEYLFNITTYEKNPSNTNLPVIKKTDLGNKKWFALSDVGGDGVSGICSKNSSNKNGFCGLEVNASKLQFFNGIYFGFSKNGGKVDIFANPFKSGVFISIGDNQRIKPTKEETEAVSGSVPVVTKYAEVNFGDIKLSDNDEGHSKLLTRCVAFE